MDSITVEKAPVPRAGRRFRPCVPDVNVDAHLIAFLCTNAFYAEINRHIKKVYTKDIPTACVTFDRADDIFVLYINPDYIKQLNPKQVQALLTHEFCHIVFGHLAAAQKPHKLWNIAQDLHINGIIKRSMKIDGKNLELHPSWCTPGVRATHPDGTQLTDEEMGLYPLVDFIEKLPDDASSTQYYHALVQAGFDKSIKDDEDAFFGFTGADFHESEGLGADVDDYIIAKAKALAERATKQADAMGSWGNIPHEMRTSLRNWINRSVDWRAILRQWIGYLNRGAKKSTIKKINRRYPYIHPGTQRSTVAKLLIAVDQSGSVYDEMLELLFSEIMSLADHVEIDFVVFDYTVDESSLFTLPKRSKPQLVRTRCGGTCFDAPTDFVNAPENRGRWDGLLILTDGQAPKPGPCNIRRGWVYPDSCKLYFETDETQIVISKDQEGIFG